MPEVFEKKEYKCNLCSRLYKTPDEARECEQGHDIVYLPIERADLMRLIQFVATGEPKLLTRSLIDLLQKYSNARTTML